MAGEEAACVCAVHLMPLPARPAAAAGNTIGVRRERPARLPQREIMGRLWCDMRAANRTNAFEAAR